MSIVAIIDDDASVLASLARLFASSGYKTRAFSSAQEFLDCPDVDGVACIVSDLQMPGITGLELQESLLQKLPAVSIVFVSGHGNIGASVAAMKAGAVDFLEKPVDAETLLAAVERATQRTQERKTNLAELGQLKNCFATLTPREREVFALIAAGLLNKQVGAHLGAAEKTIKQHRARVMDKMGAESLAQLVIMAERLGVRPVVDASKATGRISPR